MSKTQELSLEYIDRLSIVHEALRSFASFFSIPPPRMIISNLFIRIKANSIVSHYAEELEIPILGNNVVIGIQTITDLENSNIALMNLQLCLAQHADLISSKNKIDGNLHKIEKIEYTPTQEYQSSIEYSDLVAVSINKLHKQLSGIAGSHILIDPILISIQPDTKLLNIAQSLDLPIFHENILFSITNELDCDIILIQLHKIVKNFQENILQLNSVSLPVKSNPIEYTSQSSAMHEIEANQLFSPINFDDSIPMPTRANSIINDIEKNTLFSHQNSSQNEFITNNKPIESTKTDFSIPQNQESPHKSIEVKKVPKSDPIPNPPPQQHSWIQKNMKMIYSGIFIGVLIVFVVIGLKFVE